MDEALGTFTWLCSVAARLTVIVSQSATRNSSQADIEETLVAELMMTPGLDATLIGPIETIQADSTDFLCLSGFNHNFGFVSWLDEQQVIEHWQRLGLAGTVARPGQAVTNGDASRKPRVYFFQLIGSDAGSQILKQLEELQRDRAVKTVDIALTLPIMSPMGSKSMVSKPTVPESSSNSSPAIAATSKVPPAVPRQADPTNADQRPPVEPDEDDEQWQQLDQLVDELDAFDL
ncbi:MAG: hypothetical protein R3C53_01195 [Pirellulaceae bacterium]